MLKYNTDKIEYFWDIGRQKYVALLKETQDIKIVEKEHILNYLYSVQPELMQETNKKIFSKISQKYLSFEPLKGINWNLNTFEYKNLYIPSEIALKAIKIKKEGLHTVNVNFAFLDKYKHIKALFKNLTPKKEHREYLLNWLSYIFVTKKKTRNTIMLNGIPGTGKGVLWEQIIEYFAGKNYCLTVENDTLKSNFTPNGMERTLFVLANEIKGDFRDGNFIYEKLKMWISDHTIRQEEKGVQALSVPNHFNMLFFSNNKVPLQIQGNDRRYTIIPTAHKKLDTVAESMGETIEQFIHGIQVERDRFLIDLCNYAHNQEKATAIIHTEEKERIYRASMTKIEILSDKIINFDRDFIENDLLELAEQEENIIEMVKILPLTKALSLVSQNNLLEYFQNMTDLILDGLINDAKIDNRFLTFLYKIFIGGESDKKIGTHLNTFFGKSKTYNGIRKREIKEFLEDEHKNKYIPF